MPSLKEKIKLYNLFPKKNFSQNFIYDDKILFKIVNAIDDISDLNVIEIGPGPGTLTEKIISKKPKTFTVIEIDTRFEQILHEISNDIKIIFADFLKLELQGIIDKDSVIYSNLPYSISSQILFKLFDIIPNQMVLLFQKEMATRIIGKIGSKDYGKISIITSLLYDVEKITDIKPGSFYPAPDVTSTLLKFTKKSQIPQIDLAKFNKLLTLCFANRRKQLKNNLKSIILDDEIFFKKVNLNINIRAEDVSIENYLLIYKEIQGAL